MSKLACFVSALLLSSCIMVPDSYLGPVKTFPTQNPKTIAIEGFKVGGFQTTGYTTNSNFGVASASSNTGVNVNGSYLGGGVSTQNQYVVTSAAEEFRGILSETGCFRIVSEGSKADLKLIGQVESGPAMTWHHAFQFFEGLTLTPLLGMPVPMRGSGSASANIYQGSNGELVKSIKTGTVYLTGWIPIYSSKAREAEGLATLRSMAMRDLAERLASTMCFE